MRKKFFGAALSKGLCVVTVQRLYGNCTGPDTCCIHRSQNIRPSQYGPPAGHCDKLLVVVVGEVPYEAKRPIWRFKEYDVCRVCRYNDSKPDNDN